MKPENDKTTPRPWVAGDTAIWTSTGKCVMPYPNYKSHDFIVETEANANLIVEAVNQFSALKEVAEAAKELVVAMGDAKKGSHRVRFERVQKLNESLAKLETIRKG